MGMQRTSVFFCGIFCSPRFSQGRNKLSSNSGSAGNQGSPTPTQDCSRYFDEAREATRNAQLHVARSWRRRSPEVRSK